MYSMQIKCHSLAWIWSLHLQTKEKMSTFQWNLKPFSYNVFPHCIMENLFPYININVFRHIWDQWWHWLVSFYPFMFMLNDARHCFHSVHDCFYFWNDSNRTKISRQSEKYTQFSELFLYKTNKKSTCWSRIIFQFCCFASCTFRSSWF